GASPPSSRPEITTRLSVPSRRANSSPIPEPPPVIRTLLPESSIVLASPSPVHHGHRTGLVRSCADQCELGALRKQSPSGSERSRTHVEAVFVDEVVPDEALGGSNTPVEQQVPGGVV